MCSDVENIQAKQAILCKCDNGLCVAPFFAESTTILDVLAHFDILLMLLSFQIFKFRHLD